MNKANYTTQRVLSVSHKKHTKQASPSISQAVSIGLTSMHFRVVMITVVIILALFGYKVYVRGQIYSYESAIRNLNIETNVLQQQTDAIYSKITQHTDYESIKRIAEEEGMTVDGTRVKTINE